MEFVMRWDKPGNHQSFQVVAKKNLTTLAFASMTLIRTFVWIILVTFCIQNADAAPITAISISVSATFTGTYYGPDGTPSYHGTSANSGVTAEITLYDPQYNAATGLTTVTVGGGSSTVSGPLPLTTMESWAADYGTTLSFSSACVAENYVPCMGLELSSQTGTYPAIVSGYVGLTPGPEPTGSTVFTIQSGGMSMDAQGSATICCSYSGSVTSGSFTVTPITCGTIISNLPTEMKIGAVAPLSATGQPTSINALFTPVDGLTLSQAATLCGYTGWDFQQYVTALPSYQSSRFAPAGGGSAPTTPFLDPVTGGYAYQGSSTCLAYPYYYDPSSTATNCSLTNATQNANNLLFNDNPEAACNLVTYSADGSSCFLPGDSFGFSTQLVGILPDGQPSNPLYYWNWTDNYSAYCPASDPITGNCIGTLSSGGISRLDSGVPVDPGGNGGITILSMGPVDQSSVPEPASGILLVSALVMFGFCLRSDRPRSPDARDCLNDR
jgi:hypothetical protein